MAVQDYEDLRVWQKAMDLVELIYQVTRTFPKEELYSLTKQVRRAAVSVPSNIAEGQGRASTRGISAISRYCEGIVVRSRNANADRGQVGVFDCRRSVGDYQNGE
jgi:23S rRNA-intervening sequence protein